MKMHHEADPRDEMMAKCQTSGIQIMCNEVLIAIYQRPEKTKGGIILSEKTIDEEQWQGKIGLVVDMGPQAFVDSPEWKFDGVKPEIGDWVAVRVGGAWGLKIDDNKYRLVPDYAVKMIVDSPDRIY